MSVGDNLLEQVCRPESGIQADLSLDAVTITVSPKKRRLLCLSKRNRRILTVTGVPVAAAALPAIYIALALTWNYSTGERAGFLQKIVGKGWTCRTWEGELLLVALPGAASEKFLFTARDAEVAKQVNAAVGKRVALTCKQHKGLPSSCFGESEYFIVGLKGVDQ